MPKAKKSKSKAKKKPKAKPKSKPKKAKEPKPIGRISHYFPKIGVAVVDVSKKMKVGDKIKIAGHGKEFEQEVKSMQIEHKQIKEAKKGQSIGMKVKEHVKEKDLVYKA